MLAPAGERRTRAGRPMGLDERIAPRATLDLFLGGLGDLSHDAAVQIAPAAAEGQRFAAFLSGYDLPVEEQRRWRV